jgi:hypothetical protein
LSLHLVAVKCQYPRVRTLDRHSAEIFKSTSTLKAAD